MMLKKESFLDSHRAWVVFLFFKQRTMKKTILAVLLTTLLGSGSAQTLKEIHYQDSEQNLTGLVTDNVNQSEIGVLILPAWMGIDQEAKDAALLLQKRRKVIWHLLLIFMAMETDPKTVKPPRGFLVDLKRTFKPINVESRWHY